MVRFFHFHRWTKWVTQETLDRYGFRVQCRVCAVCGFEQEHRIRDAGE